MFRADVDEVNVEPVDLGDEVWDSFQLRLALSPVVICSPVARELLHRRQLHALRCIVDQFSFWPPGRVDATAKISKLRVWKIELKGPYGSLVRNRPAGWLCSAGLSHVVLL